MGRRVHATVDGAQQVDAHQPVALTGANDERGDARGVVLRQHGHLAHPAHARRVGVIDGQSQQFGERKVIHARQHNPKAKKPPSKSRTRGISGYNPPYHMSPRSSHSQPGARRPVSTANARLRTLAGQLLTFGFDGTTLTPELRSTLRDLQPGGVILFARNIHRARQTHRCCKRCAKTLRATALPLRGPGGWHRGPSARRSWPGTQRAGCGCGRPCRLSRAWTPAGRRVLRPGL